MPSTSDIIAFFKNPFVIIWTSVLFASLLKYVFFKIRQLLHAQRTGIYGLRTSFILLGLLLSIALTIIAFSYTEFPEEVLQEAERLSLNEDIEQIPRTWEPPKQSNFPPPIDRVELIVDDELPSTIFDSTTLLVAQKMEEAMPQNSSSTLTTFEPPLPPSPPKREIKKPAEVQEIFKIVEEMPTFPGCESEANKVTRKRCADEKMLEFIYKHIRYPALARENNIEGTAVITFVVERDGSITDVKVLRDPGAGTGDEALRVVTLMNDMSVKWNPGKQRSNTVRVQLNLPIKFKLHR